MASSKLAVRMAIGVALQVAAHCAMEDACSIDQQVEMSVEPSLHNHSRVRVTNKHESGLNTVRMKARRVRNTLFK